MEMPLFGAGSTVAGMFSELQLSMDQSGTSNLFRDEAIAKLME
jgi:hypothetical protein